MLIRSAIQLDTEGLEEGRKERTTYSQKVMFSFPLNKKSILLTRNELQVILEDDMESSPIH